MMKGLGRSRTSQALENLAQALRALEMVDEASSQDGAGGELCPPPLTVVRAEIENARRYLAHGAQDL
ncbi:MAG: hypothetical protein AAGJ70_09460 [Pseudomonadota bacterium]